MNHQQNAAPIVSQGGYFQVFARVLYVIPLITRTSGLLREVLQQYSDKNIFATDWKGDQSVAKITCHFQFVLFGTYQSLYRFKLCVPPLNTRDAQVPGKSLSEHVAFKKMARCA